LVDALIGGWRLSNIVVVQTGPYLSPYFNNIDPSGTGSGLGAVISVVGGTPQVYVGGGRSQAPDKVASAVPSGQNANNWINKAGFVCPGVPNWKAGDTCDIGTQGSSYAPIGRFGSARPGSIVGPGTVNLSTGLAKNLAITERVRLRAEGTFTNVLNHANLGDPNLNVGSGNFGVITSVRGVDYGANRTGQVSMRLEF
jgi:hypothetical protein